MSNNLFRMHKTLAQSVVSTNFNPKITTQPNKTPVTMVHQNAAAAMFYFSKSM